MELKLNIGYQELLALVQQLPDDQILRLRKDLDRKKRIAKSKWREMLLTGPVMDDQQFEQFEQNREHFNQWKIN